MRRSVLSAVLAAALSVVACSEQPTEVTPPQAVPVEPGAAAVVGCPASTTAAQILTLVNELLPRSPIRTSVIALIAALPPRAQDRIKLAVRRAIFPIMDLILRSFYAGRLTGGKSDATFAKVIKLIEALHCYVGMTPPSFPTTTAGSDFVLGVALPNVQTTIVVPSREAGALIPRTAVTTAMGPALVAIFDLPNEPPPLRTSLDQYPRFYHFSGTTASGPVVFNTDITAATCFRGRIEGDGSNLRLAHNVGPNFGDVEVLPRPAAVPSFISCPEEVGSTLGGAPGRFAWAERLFLPAQLQAASFPPVAIPNLPVGGTTRKFSEFGIVDIFSNPGAFGPVGPTSTTEVVGRTVTRTVLVTSQNDTPIHNVPVTFATANGTLLGGSPQTVFTNEDGNASVSWTLPPASGVNTLTAEVTEEDNPPLETNDPPSSNIASIPDVDFNTGSLTFTATATSAPAVSIASFAGNGQSAPAGSAVPIPPAVVVRDAFGNPVPSVVVTFALVSADGAITGATAATNADGVAAVGSWILAVGENTLEASAPGLSGSPVTFTATGEARETTTLITDDDPDPSIAGQDIVVSFRVTGSIVPKGARPTGTVQVIDGMGASCTGGFVAVTIEGAALGHCTLTPQTVGTLTLTAVYSGDSEFAGSSDTETHVVNASPSISGFGVNSSSDGLWEIDFQSGAASFIGRLGGANLNLYTTAVAMAVRPSDGRLFVWSNSGDGIEAGASNGVLLTVDPETGQGSPANPDTPNQGTLGALSFSPSGALFGVESSLFTVNASSGVVTVVGSLGSELRVGGADFSCSGVLYGLELNGERLVTINTTTGGATVVATLSQNLGTTGSIVFTPSGTLVGSALGPERGSVLFDIDPANGEVSNVRSLSAPSAQGMGIARTCIN